ncbi:MAG: pyridoxamine 5'-phosphate oxidase family protein [Polyangiaceae bacterium]
MGKIFEALDEGLCEFIRAQHVFFVATAPLAADGHVNVSPKGHDSLRILSPTRLAYLDLVGSGVETIAHLRENGRVCLMWLAFEGKPRILRVHGRGRPVFPHEIEFEELAGHFPSYPNQRSILVIEALRIADSCGYSVPLMDFVSDRDQLSKWADRKGPDGIRAYLEEKNLQSLDGLPGLDSCAIVSDP